MTALEHALNEMSKGGRRAFRTRVRMSMRRYDRERDLQRLVPCPPHYADTPDGPEKTRKIITLLKNGVRYMRYAETQGRWFYDRNRHISLLGALGAEMNHLKTFTCANCSKPSITELDGDQLCKTHADAWVRAEGQFHQEAQDQ